MFRSLLLLATLLLTLSLGLDSIYPTPSAPPIEPASHTIPGDSTIVSGAEVVTWAKVEPKGYVTEVGLHLPLAVVEHPPHEPGNGPLGAIATLGFPAIVQDTAYFNHFELHWNPYGHEPAGYWDKPHFDFHFYGMPLEGVVSISCPDILQPAPEQIPSGYIYPGSAACAPMMGVHSMRLVDLMPRARFTAVMLAGFSQGEMHFLEPMITQEFLLKRKNFTMAVPQPERLGRSMRYPTEFQAIYDQKTDAYRFIFNNFKSVR